MWKVFQFFLLFCSSLTFPTLHLASAIVLQPHQEKSSQYLLTHPEQKGLLLYHSLGSGKTYITLEYAEKNPDKPVVILLPEFLKANWLTQMKSFGVKNVNRYQMITLENIDLLLKQDLSKTIVIVDEIHKLIQRIRLSTVESEKYILAYEKLKSAQKLLLLTGTPVFVDTSDISFIANLLEEGDPYPIDPMKFRTEYMRIKPFTSLTRGYLTESKLFMMAVPFFVTLSAIVTLSTTAPLTVPFLALGGSAIIPITNEISPPSQIAFREFDTEKWSSFASKNISYYRVQLAKDSNYPDKKLHEKVVPYNDYQTHFFLSFADEDLNLEQLKILLADEKITYSDTLLRIHSAKLQKQLLAQSATGREIANLECRRSENNEIIEAPKFLQILDTIRKNTGQVVVYSNYYHNGILRFTQFLDRNGFKEQYTLLTPQQTTEEQMQTIEAYNQTKKRILLIHPEITEGISLKGTEQLHILEPIPSLTLQEQLIGRTIRYQSHLHLPETRRVVNVYLWEASVDYGALGMPTSANQIRREHWQRKYAEINPSMWTKGILEVDSNYFLKDETPDARLKRRNLSTQKDIESLNELLNGYSIEHQAQL